MSTTEIPTDTPAASSRNQAPVFCDRLLGRAVQQGLEGPVDNLRASMRTLEERFESSDPRGAELARALAQVEQLGRSVRDLLDYAYLPEPKDLECTIDEILYSARFRVPHEMWKQLWVAREKELPSLRVDGPVLARSIARLVEAAAPLATAGVLLNVVRDQGATVFTITFRGRADYCGDPLGLCYPIASRDLSLIGCPMTEFTSALDDTTITIRVPAERSTAFEESAA